MGHWTIFNQDILEWAKTYKGEKFHALLCDPPYELSFMGKHWDGQGVAFSAETWSAISEHLYDGAFIMVYGGSRTFHRVAVAIEDAGFVIHPVMSMLWVQGQGFPKASRIDTQIDKNAGVEQQKSGEIWRSMRLYGVGLPLEVRDDNDELLDVVPLPPLSTHIGRYWNSMIITPDIAGEKEWSRELMESFFPPAMFRTLIRHWNDIPTTQAGQGVPLSGDTLKPISADPAIKDSLRGLNSSEHCHTMPQAFQSFHMPIKCREPTSDAIVVRRTTSYLHDFFLNG